MKEKTNKKVEALGKEEVLDKSQTGEEQSQSISTLKEDFQKKTLGFSLSRSYTRYNTESSRLQREELNQFIQGRAKNT